jgi:hypothetical protein
MKREMLVGSLAVLLIVTGHSSGLIRATYYAGEPGVAPPMLIDNFEAGNNTSLLGTAWASYSDAAVGGKSTCHISIIDGGANGTRKALRLTGSVKPDFQYGFAGAGVALSRNGHAQDLTSYSGIRFWAKGDGNTYQVRLQCTAVRDHNDFAYSFVAGKAWTPVSVRFSELAQSQYFGTQIEWTGRDVAGIAFQTAQPPEYSYSLEIDEISIY